MESENRQEVDIIILCILLAFPLHFALIYEKLQMKGLLAMSDVTAERRLELIRNIREENQKNRMSMKNREHILYGKEYETAPMRDTGEMPAAPAHGSSLILRIIIAAVLLSLFIIMDYLQADWLPVDMEAINDSLKENYTVNIIDFMDKITYTLDNENSPAAE